MSDPRLPARADATVAPSYPPHSSGPDLPDPPDWVIDGGVARPREVAVARNSDRRIPRLHHSFPAANQAVSSNWPAEVSQWARRPPLPWPRVAALTGAGRSRRGRAGD